ncbi:MYXO-CTERM sorting domain-containing protein [Mycobacterium sp. D16R24]|uniref:MYXO-CTERM sorting domain-containing protein n=1 Tax=Mycobacterium sp. D16R24 TaxID=1855656 RepID=UPI00336A8375
MLSTSKNAAAVRSAGGGPGGTSGAAASASAKDAARATSSANASACNCSSAEPSAGGSPLIWGLVIAGLAALPVRRFQMPFNPTEGGGSSGDPVAELVYDVSNAADAPGVLCLRTSAARTGGPGRRVRDPAHRHRCG